METKNIQPSLIKAFKVIKCTFGIVPNVGGDRQIHQPVDPFRKIPPSFHKQPIVRSCIIIYDDCGDS